MVPPPFVMRQFVKTGVFLPERLGILFVGAAEMAGCVLFDELRRVGVALPCVVTVDRAGGWLSSQH